MLSVDWNSERPTDSDVAAMWGVLDVRNVTYSSDAIMKYLSSVRQTHVNGGALLSCYSVGPDTTFDWFASRNRLPEIFAGFIRLPGVQESALDLLQNASDPQLEQKWGMPFILEGELTAILVSGGAYERFPGLASDAIALSAAFRHAVIEDRYSDAEVYCSCKPWSPWFFDIAWDCTYVVLDKGKRLLWLMVITDTD